MSHSSVHSLNLKKIVKSSIFPVYACLIVLWVVVSILLPSFASTGRIIDVLHTTSFLGIVALGQTLVILLGGIDVSVSGVMTLSTMIAAALIQANIPPALAVVLTIAACSLIGVFNALGIIYLQIAPMLMTMATLSIIEGSLLLATNGNPPSAHCELLDFLGHGKIAGIIPVSVILWLIAVLIFYLLLNKNKFGLKIYGTGINTRASFLSGIETNKLTLKAYMLSAAMAGLAGVMYLGYIGNTYINIGTPFQMDSITATVLGGTAIIGGRGNCIGTVAGAIIIVVLRDALNIMNTTQAIREILMGVLIISLLLAYAREKKER